MTPRICPTCNGIGYVFTQRHQTYTDILSGKYKPGELVYGVRQCPGCLLVGADIGPLAVETDPVGIVAEGWCDFAERQARNGRVMRRVGAHPLATA